MSKIKFHKIAAVIVLIVTAAWVATGEFSSVGSAANEAETPQQREAEKSVVPIRTVGVVSPPSVAHARAIRISGYTDADKRAILATRSAGIVAQLPIDIGDQVKAGDLIVKLEAEGKEAAVEMTRQLLAQREAEADATRRLAERGSVPTLQLDNALSVLAAARSQLEAAIAELDRNTVRAPFDGMIDKVDTELGSSVQAGTQIATILNLDPILAIGQVSERDLAHIQTGDTAKVRLVNGREIEGVVRHVSRDAAPATRTFRVEVAIANRDRTVPAGMTAEITLHSKPVMSMILPRSVVTLSDKGDLGIRAVNTENKAVFYPIDIVDDMPEGLVLGGIPENTLIIVAGQEMISEGDKVNPVKVDGNTMKDATGQLTNSAK